MPFFKISKAAENAADQPIQSATEAADTDVAKTRCKARRGERTCSYTSSLVTPASLMETLLSLLACLSSMIEASPAAERSADSKHGRGTDRREAQAVVSDASSTAFLPATVTTPRKRLPR